MASNSFLVYCSLLTRSAYRSLREIARLQPTVVDVAQIDAAITQAAEARLELAIQLVDFGSGLLQAAPLDTITARTVVSRSYYAAHHALRALVLFVERGDEDGHLGVIEAACRLIALDGLLSTRFGSAQDLRINLKKLMHHRHLADYYPFGASAPQEPPLDFIVVAPQAYQTADKIVKEVSRYISEKKGSTP